MARAFNRTGATRAVALEYPRLLTEFGMMVYFTNVRNFRSVIGLFSVIGGFRWF